MGRVLFLVWFKLKLSETMSQRQAFEAWTLESKEAPKVIPRERVKGLYKVAGKQELVALLDFDSHQELDETLSRLTLLREAGRSLSVEITPLYAHADFVKYAEGALGENMA